MNHSYVLSNMTRLELPKTDERKVESLFESKVIKNIRSIYEIKINESSSVGLTRMRLLILEKVKNYTDDFFSSSFILPFSKDFLQSLLNKLSRKRTKSEKKRFFQFFLEIIFIEYFENKIMNSLYILVNKQFPVNTYSSYSTNY